MSVPGTTCIKKCRPDFYEMKLMTSKSKEDFLKEYEKYDEQTAKNFYLRVLTEIENSITDGNIDNLKLLSNVIDYINCVKNYQSTAKEFLKSTNLVVLTCKLNQVCVLQYLFNSDNKLLNKLSVYSGICISPDDKDETCHNAFYYAIRSGNAELLHGLLRWPGENKERFFDTHLDDLDRILSTTYEELKLRNVQLTDEMEFLVQNKLLSLRFYYNSSEQDQNTNLDNIEKRIKLLLDNIELLKNDYSDADVDERFLFIAKFIAQNIQILKWQLKFTYDRLPWEEMEFCLICFVFSHIKQQEINLFYLATLNKVKILYHLENFAKELGEINGEYLEKRLEDIKGKSSKKPDAEITIENSFAKLPILNREESVPDILKIKPQFYELYRNYQQVRDIYSLEKINKYINLTLSANPAEKHGQLIILRSLQVIGEHLKNTWESPKLSTATGDLILLSITKNTRNVIQKIRDSLSKAESIFERTEIEENSHIFFTGIQNDIKRIGDVIIYILCNKKFKIIKELLQKIVNSKSTAEIKEAVEVLGNAGGNISVSGLDMVGKIISENFKTTEDQRLEKLLRELRDNIPDKNSNEENLFSRIDDLMNSTKYKSENMKIYYRLGFHKLKVLNIMMDDTKVDQNTIRITKSIVARILENMPQPIEPDTLKKIAKLSLDIFHSVKSKINVCKIDEISRIFSQIFYIADFKTNDVPWIQELKEKIYQKKKKNRLFIKRDYNSVLESKQRELKNILNCKCLCGDLIENVSQYKQDEKLQAVIEMLVLDIMSILLEDQKLEINYFFLDDNYPLLNGRCLRNHLAHENTLVALLTDPLMSILLNARKLTEGDILTSSRRFGKLVRDDPSKLQEKCEKCLHIIAIQKKMFAALEEGKIESFKECLIGGADVNARNIHLWSTLHFAAKGQSLEALKFIHAQNPNADVKDVNCRSPLHIAATYGRTNNTEYLIEEAGLSVSEVDGSKNSPLHIAAQNGHKETITILLKYKSNDWITYDFTPLYSAIRNNHVDIVQLLLEENGSISIDMHESVGGFSPLHDAAERGHIEIVQLLLEMNADVNAKSDTDYTPLHAAVLSGNLAVVNALISKGANINAEDVEGCTPLNHAVLNNHAEIVKVFLKHDGNPNVKQKIDKYTPLHLAVNNGYEEIVTVLLDYHANLNEQTTKKRTPINIAASQGHVKVLLILIRRGANLDSRSEEEFTPLHCAAFKGHESIVKILIEKGAKIDATTTKKCTPLYLAALEGHKDIVKLLIEKKADIYAKSNGQSSVLHAAAFNGNKEVIDIFLSNKVDVNARDIYGCTPMHVAACNEHNDALHSLIRNQAEVNVTDIFGLTPLHVAAKEGIKDAVDILIHNNAEINAKDNANCIPLHFAVDRGHLDVINVLTQHGSDVNAKRNVNLPTSLLSAIKHNHKEIIDVLIAKGAYINGEKGEPLYLAVIAGYSDIVTKLIDKKAQLDIKYTNDFTLLHFAAKHGHKKVVNILIEKRANVNAITINSVTPLHLAAHEGYEDIVQILIKEGSDVSIKSDTGFTSLHTAAEQGHTNIVGILLQNGAYHNAKDDKNRTPLELAVSNGHSEVVKLFLQCKDINITDKGNDDCTMLHVSAQGFNLETVKILVEYGADINARNSFTLKPIHIAARKGFKEAVEFFLNVGSNINDCCSFNMTLLHFAALENRLEIVKYLLDQRANVNAKNAGGVSPLHIAAKACNKDIVEVLLKHGAVYNAVDKSGNKPLDMANDDIVRSFLTTIDSFFKAVKNNNHREVERCVNAGVVVDVKNRKSEAPLHYAAWKGYDKIVDILLEYNANPNVVSKKGFTPLHYAVKFSHRKVIEVLLSHGAVFNIHSYDGSAPIDLSTDEDISNLLNFVSELFEDVKNRDPRTINKLNNIKNVDTMRAIMCTCNDHHKTLTVLAIQKCLPEAEQLKEVLQDGVSDLINTASVLAEKGDYQKALDIFNNVFDKRTNILGTNNPGTLEIKRHIALILYKQGRYGEALSMLESIFSKQKTILGSNSQHTMNTRSSIALVLHRLGRTEEAFYIYQEVYPNQKEVLAPNHADTLKTELHMVLVLIAQGKCEMYPEIIETVIEKELELSELKTFRGLEAQNNIATILSNLGENEHALKLYENVLEIQRKIFEANHIDTLRTLQSIAQVYSNQKKYHKALQMHQEVLKIQKSVLGLDHPETLKTQYNLLNTLYSREKNVAFSKIYKECFKQMEDVYGPSIFFVQEISAKMEVIKCKFIIEGCRIEEILQKQDDIKTVERDGDTEAVQHLPKAGADLNDKDSYGRVLLHYAAINGCTDLVNILLENGAAINDKDNKGITPVHYATSNGHTDTVNMLIYNGACVTQSTDKINTPLHIAALNNNKELVEIFLKHVSRDELGDFINAKTISSGNTALHVASQKGSLEIVHILLKYGASYDIENNECKKPLDLSTDKTVSSLLELLAKLFEAAERGDERIVEKLRAVKTDNVLEISNVRNKERKTLIQVSIMNKHRVLAKKLVELFKD